MEDFGSVFWVLLAVGAFIYNIVVQARKGDKKGGGHAHGEAWPSMQPDDAPRTGKGQHDAQPRPEERQFDGGTWSGSGQSDAPRTGKQREDDWIPAEIKQIFGMPEQYRQDAASDSEATSSEELYEEELYADEAQSLEEIPAEEYASLETAEYAANSGFSRMTANMKTPEDARTDYAGEEIAGEEIADSPAAAREKEFDLRRAVIDAEILKPKFSEEQA